MNNNEDNGREYTSNDNSGYYHDGKTTTIVYSELTEEQKRAVNRVGGCLAFIIVMPFLLAGIAFLIVGITQYFEVKNDEKQCTELITGTITYENVSESDIVDENGKVIGHSASCSGARILIYNYNGHEYREKCESDLKNRNISLDDKLEIYVDPSDPKHFYYPFKIENDKNGWLEIAVVGGVICFVIIAIVMAVIIKRKIRSSKNSEYY